MITTSIRESESLLNALFVQQGLPAFRWGEVMDLMDHTWLDVAKTKILNNQNADLLEMLTGKRAERTMGFMQNFVSGRFKHVFKKQFVAQMTKAMINSLQLNSTTSEKIAQKSFDIILSKAIQFFASRELSIDQLRLLCGIDRALPAPTK